MEVSAKHIGATVEFNYGPMHGSERGTVIDCVTDRWGTHLVAIVEGGARKTINRFTTVGIGAYLIEAPARKINRNSPWYRPE